MCYATQLVATPPHAMITRTSPRVKESKQNCLADPRRSETRKTEGNDHPFSFSHILRYTATERFTKEMHERAIADSSLATLAAATPVSPPREKAK